MQKIYIYQIEDGGAGFVKADSKREAIKKVKESYSKESVYDGPSSVEVKIIGCLNDSKFNEDDIYEAGWSISIVEC